jgi:hypothetical protein
MITFQTFNCLALKSLAVTCLTFIFTQFSVSFHTWANKLAVNNATETLNYTWPIDIFNMRLKTKYPFRMNKIFYYIIAYFAETITTWFSCLDLYLLYTAVSPDINNFYTA